jgi:DNA-3-methyladenine glycosylase I
VSRSLTRGPDGRPRCWWALSKPEYLAYHDEEWGRPVVDDRGLFERLCLEAFQSGLSWLTILRKRKAFRAAFEGFEIESVAGFGRRDVNRLLRDEGIIRNRAKIEAAIANARAALRLSQDGETLAELIWSFAPRRPRKHRGRSTIPATTSESTALESRRSGRVPS